MKAAAARTTVASLHVAAGGFLCATVGTIWICAALLAPMFEGSFVPGLVEMFGRPIAMVMIGFGLIEIAAAWALLRRKTWAPGALLAVSVVQLAIFPIGTAVAVLTGWLLLTSRKNDEQDDPRRGRTSGCSDQIALRRSIWPLTSTQPPLND